MSDYAVRVENLGKKYVINHEADRGAYQYVALRDVLAGIGRSAIRSLRGSSAPKATSEDLWAVRDLNFDIREGEVVGIVGRNGAGKSTLLKLLSRITEPTTGRIRLRGRIASLLEVGTGFHPELTGRENVFLNGVIMGMRRREVAAKFDEIVAFAEVEKFIDTPVKRYSSGMYMRLAFAVAAHLEPDILVIDEVLAVGDVRFQRKCMEKMSEVGGAGRTVLFVSHNMPAVTRLCPRSIFMSEGRVVDDGPSDRVVAEYLGSGLGTTARRVWDDPRSAPGDDVVRLRSVAVRDAAGKASEILDRSDPIALEMEYEVLTPGIVLAPICGLKNQEGVVLFQINDWNPEPRPVGIYRGQVVVPAEFLAEGLHFATFGIGTPSPTVKRFVERDAIAFQVVENSENATRAMWGGHLPGVVRPDWPWETEYRAPHSAVWEALA